MKKSFLILIVFCIFVLCGCTDSTSKDTLKQIQKRGVLKVGVKYDSKPFGFTGKNGEIQGLDADIARHIARYILHDEYKVEFKPVTAQDRIMALNSEDVDLIIATMSINERRSLVVDFSLPYFTSGAAILVPAKSHITSIKDLNGEKTVVVLGSTIEKTVQKYAPKAIIQGVKTYTQGFRLLESGNASALVADDSILYGLIINNSGYKILPQRYSREHYAVALRKGEENRSLLQAVNLILDDLYSKGELSRIKQKWIPKTQ